MTFPATPPRPPQYAAAKTIFVCLMAFVICRVITVHLLREGVARIGIGREFVLMRSHAVCFLERNSVRDEMLIRYKRAILRRQGIGWLTPWTTSIVVEASPVSIATI